MRTRHIAWIAFLPVLSLAACKSGDAGSGAAVAAPSDLAVEPLDNAAHLTWKDNSDNESAFMIQRKTGNSDWQTVASVPFDTTQYHDANLEPGRTYMYRVMAMSKDGQHGPYSNQSTCMIPPHAGAGMIGHEGHTGATAGAAGG